MSDSDNGATTDSSESVSTDAVMTTGELSPGSGDHSSAASQASPRPPLSPFAAPPPRRQPDRIPDRELPRVSEEEQYYRRNNLMNLPVPDGSPSPGSAAAASRDQRHRGGMGGDAAMGSPPGRAGSSRIVGGDAAMGSPPGRAGSSRNVGGDAAMGSPPVPARSSRNVAAMGHRLPAGLTGSPQSPAGSSADGGAMASPDHFYSSRRASTVGSTCSPAASDLSAYGISPSGFYPRALDFGPAIGSNESLQMGPPALPQGTYGGPLGSPFNSHPGSPQAAPLQVARVYGDPRGLPPVYYGSMGTAFGNTPADDDFEEREDTVTWQASWQASWQHHARTGSLPPQHNARAYGLRDRPVSQGDPPSGAGKAVRKKDKHRNNQ